MKTVMLRNVEVGCGKPKVIVPIVAATAQGILEKAREFRAHALDVVEWRVDFYEDVFQLPKVLSTLKGLREILGDGTYWLRPPYGAIQEAQKPQISVPMVTWTVDSRDWESLSAKTVVQSVLRDVKPNSIILMHDIYPSSVDAALEIVDTLQAQGYWFVTVEELLALNGVAAEPGVLYRVIG